jgi:cell division protein FtsI (penicillin-binding protein 3)/stage V sporulation protein D (sporulation-specific penicillin-binding protein)
MKNWRENLIFFLVFVFFSIVVARLFYLQVLKGPYYQAFSSALFHSLETKSRGKIFFRDGESLAVNKIFKFLYLNPQKIKDQSQVAEKLSSVLNLDKTLILEKIKTNTPFLVLKKDLSDEEVEKIKSLNLAGVFVGEEEGRYYPHRELAASLVGFVDADGNGRYGLEEFYDQELKEGNDLILTVDYKIQSRAEEILAKAKENLDFESAQIIVADPQSGEILAMANYPSFDPNSYSQYKNLEIFKNPASQTLFEPGSVLKSITMAIALAEGKITPQTTYRDPGQIKINGWVIQNYDGRQYPGEITMTQVLEKSINTGAVFAKSQVENSVFLEYLKKFGFFEKTGVDLFETYSENRELKSGREVNLITASFGQGIAITPLQLVRAYCAIANGGKLPNLHLVENDSQTKEGQPILPSQVTSQLTSMLVSVVENGFAKRAKIPGYYIAGKTGTALVPKFGEKGYSEKTWQSFVGFFPALNPQFLILVKLDNPKTKTAEYSAVPIFHDLADYIIHLYQIPPDYEQNSQ